MLSIIQDQIRLFLIAASLQGIELRTMDMGLPRQKSMWWIHLYMIFKTMSMSIIAKIAQSRDANQKQGRHLSILLHDFQRGNIAEEDIARLIYCLVYREEKMTSNNRSCREARSGYSSESAFESRLVLAGTDGQLAIRYEAPILRYTRSRIAAMQALVRKYHGELVFTEKTDKNGNKNAYVALHYNV